MNPKHIAILTVTACMSLASIGVYTVKTNNIFTARRGATKGATTLTSMETQIEEFLREQEKESNGMKPSKDSTSDNVVPPRDSNPIEVDPGELYQNQPNLVADTSHSVTDGGFTLYSAPTVNSTSNTYSFNVEKATQLTYDLLHSYLPGVTLKHDNDMDWVLGKHMWTIEHKRTGTAWQKNGNIKKLGLSNISVDHPAGYIVKNNVKYYLVAMPAGVLNQSIYSSGKWQTQTGGSASDFGNYNGSILANVVMTKGGTDYYLPVTFGDAEGHTYPGGLCQTSIAAAGGKFAYQGSSGSDWTTHEIASPANFPAAYNNLLNGKWGVGKYDAAYSMHYLEMCICDPDDINVFNQHYKLKSIIIFK